MRGPFASRDESATHSRHPAYVNAMLRQVAKDCLRDHPGNLSAAREAFRATVYSDIELLQSLCEWLCRTYGDIHTQFLTDVATGDAKLRVAFVVGEESTDASGGVHSIPAFRTDRDPAARAETVSQATDNGVFSDTSGGVQESSGRRPYRDLSARAAPLSETQPSKTSPDVSEGVRSDADTRSGTDSSARAAPPPRSRPWASPEEIREALRATAKTVTKSVLDTFIADDGRPIGDLTPDEVEALITRRQRQTGFLELLIHTLPRGQNKPVRYYYVGAEAKRPDELFVTAMRGGDA